MGTKMKMLSRIFKAFYFLGIAILLVLSLWLVVNAALKKSSGFEFGNLMDFFNTLGTLGTMLIAWQVYKSAPGWFNEKKHGRAFTLAEEILFDDYNTLHFHCEKLNRTLQQFHLEMEFTETDIIFINDIDSYLQFITEFNILHSDIMKLDNKIDKISKLGFKYKQAMYDLHLEFIYYHDDVTINAKSFERKLRKGKIIQDESSRRKITAELIYILRELSQDVENLRNTNKKIKYFSDDIQHYFAIGQP